MAEYAQQLYRQLQLIDPANIVADVRFPDIKRRLTEIEAVQRGTFAECDVKQEYIRQLRELAETYRTNPMAFDYQRLTKLFRCLISYSANTIPVGTVPTLTARVSALVNDLTYAGSSHDYMIYNMISSGLDTARIKTTNSRSFTKRDNELINEVWIALLYLNTLKLTRDPSPYFKYIYAAYTCGALDPQNPSMAQSCCAGGGVFYDIEENVLNAQPLQHWLDTTTRTDVDFTMMYVQMIKAFAQAASHGVNNFKLEPIDVLVRLFPINVSLSERQIIQVPSFPVIINFASCQATPINGSNYVATGPSRSDVAQIRSLFLNRIRDRGGKLARFVASYPPETEATLELPTEILAILSGRQLQLAPAVPIPVAQFNEDAEIVALTQKSKALAAAQQETQSQIAQLASYGAAKPAYAPLPAYVLTPGQEESAARELQRRLLAAGQEPVAVARFPSGPPGPSFQAPSYATAY